MTNTLETTFNTAPILSDELEREREAFIEDNALAALRLELAGLAINASNVTTPEHFDD